MFFGRMCGDGSYVYGFESSNMGTFLVIAFTDLEFKNKIDLENEYDLSNMCLYRYTGDDRNPNQVECIGSTKEYPDFMEMNDGYPEN